MVTTADGSKMSKRLGNSVDPVTVSDQFGADILRCWAASVDYENDVPCSDELLKVAGDGYRRVRNTLRFLLSNLYDFDNDADPELMPIDQWIMERADILTADCMNWYDTYQFNKVWSAIHNFCVNDVSAVYADAIKDRMYCDGEDWETRRSAQAACHYVLNLLVRLVAPILVHTSEEVYARIPGIERLESVHMEQLHARQDASSLSQTELHRRMQETLKVRADVFALLDVWRKENGVKDSQDVEVTASATSSQIEALNSLGEELPVLFKLAKVNLSEGDFSVSFEKSIYDKCDRSRLRRADVEPVELEGESFNLTARDRRALGV
jgi:isoleucyl-tRNA synthetase